ncbi:MAG TPA: DmsC/YnfH family molybdoenzyme membrane anchor subunit, partial [Planctomycetaceae bacterium]
MELLAELFSDGLFGNGRGPDGMSSVHGGVALLFGLVALGASTLHLGRPHLAFRAVLGLRSSWLSREILAFAAFSLLAVLHAGSAWMTDVTTTTGKSVQLSLGAGVVGAGLAGVFCSIMIYQCTRRPLWNGPATAIRFLLTTVLLGLSAALFTAAVENLSPVSAGGEGAVSGMARTLFPGLIVATALKLIFEASLFRHLRSKQHTPLKRSALLMTGDLATAAKWRFALGIVGGIVWPAIWIWRDHTQASGVLFSHALIIGQFAALLAGELLERYLFFTAVVAPRMPGGLRT